MISLRGSFPFPSKLYFPLQISIYSFTAAVIYQRPVYPLNIECYAKRVPDVKLPSYYVVKLVKECYFLDKRQKTTKNAHFGLKT